MVRLSRGDWVALGRAAILDLLAEQHAAPLVELEARICDRSWKDRHNPIDPHLLTIARKELLAEGLVDELVATTRGGGDVAVFHLSPVQRGMARRISDAAARKRLLIARWKSWSRGTQHMPNLIGAGGEAVVHQSLLTSAAYGYRVLQPTRGEVATIYEQPVPGGPLDNAAWLLTMDPRTQMPGDPYLVPIEVKNVRHTLYPNHWESYQLLHKAAGLANSHPRYPVLPILICRKAHYRARQLAKDLGFLIFETHDQYVLPSERLQLDHVEEVRAELGFADLTVTDQANPRLVDWLSGTVHREAPKFATRWMDFGRHHIGIYAALRDERLRWRQRTPWLEALHAAVEANFDTAGGWAPSEEDEPGLM
ncbi:hypothetical protein SAMN05421837_104618 [Amycolatopsis pretoriensis]|uniref:Replication-relaxation n=1 Tax=Amycolatopsis pretoriensis TaxID=218821 RepID=A0A1H5QT88_9PSEU|nr:hypothetical protein SAMN05421837_104618 [Amycolatopsis pretoriensis]